MVMDKIAELEETESYQYEDVWRFEDQLYVAKTNLKKTKKLLTTLRKKYKILPR